MAKFILGYDGEWREQFTDREAAIRHAEMVAGQGHVVEVVSRRFGFHNFVSGFPESERDALRARWSWIPDFHGGDGGGGAGGHHHHHHYGSIGGHGGHGGGGGHGGHGGGH